MVWVFVVIVELIRLRDVKKIFKDGMAMLQAMGKMFTGIVALIICAEFFATGLKTSGLIDVIINSANGVGAGMGVMTVILTAIVSLVTFLTGSGVVPTPRSPLWLRTWRPASAVLLKLWSPRCSLQAA